MLYPLGIMLAALIVPLSGCIGWPSSADKSGLPATQVGGYLVKSKGLTRGGIEAPSGVIIVPTAGKDKLNGTILLDVVLLIPHKVSVRFLGTELKLQSPEWRQDRTLVVDHLTNNRSWKFPPLDPLTGTVYEPDNVYLLWYLPTQETMEPQTGLPQARSFTVVLPAIEINGEVYQPQPVIFENYTKCGMFVCKY